MPVITSDQATEWKLREMARRAGKKYEPEVENIYKGMSQEELKAHKALIRAELKDSETVDTE